LTFTLLDSIFSQLADMLLSCARILKHLILVSKNFLYSIKYNKAFSHPKKNNHNEDINPKPFGFTYMHHFSPFSFEFSIPVNNRIFFLIGIFIMIIINSMIHWMTNYAFIGFELGQMHGICLLYKLSFLNFVLSSENPRILTSCIFGSTETLQQYRALVKAYDVNPFLHAPTYCFWIPVLLACTICTTATV